MNHILETKQLTSGYHKQPVVNDVDLQIPDHKISVIIGSNACGKSTLLKTIARLNAPMSGGVYLDEQEVATIPSKQLARTLGLLPQSPLVPEGISVMELIGRGRFPYQRFLAKASSEDHKAVAEAMDMMGITQLAHTDVRELSGGQRQRVWIAMALAQQTDILFLDEPTTYLDITHQIEILDLLYDLNRKKGTTIVMVLHDINLSARYADHIFAMCNGKLISQGAPCDIIDASLIHEVFGLRSQVILDPISHTPLILPEGRHHARQQETI